MENQNVYHVSLYHYCALVYVTIEAVSCHDRSLTPFYTAKGIYISIRNMCVVLNSNEVH